MITAHIASLPAREMSLQKTIASIVNQVDKIYVSLNGYPSIPRWLESHVFAGKNVTIHTEILDNSLGDSAKFLHCWDEPSLCVVLDDDLILPQDYVETLRRGQEKYGGAVSFHGKVFSKRPVEHYRRDFTTNLRCLNTVLIDIGVDVIGSGVMMFDNTQVKYDHSLYDEKNMADILFSRLCTLQGVPMTVLAHAGGWIRYLPQETTIWRTTTDDTVQTRILNTFLT